MSINKTVLVIGATSGIGEGLARAIHAQGKKVIAAGRRQDRLNALASELPGLETFRFDFSDIAKLPSAFNDISSKYPELDTVIVAAAIQGFFDYKDKGSSSIASITQEIATNITAPTTFCQLLVPFFLKSSKPCSIIFVTSGFSFIPVPFFPVYSATKAALQSFSIALRAQLADTNIQVTTLCPGYIATEIDKDFKDRLTAMLGGPDKAPPAEPLDKFIRDAMVGLDEKRDGEPVNEVAIGDFPQQVHTSWRTAFGPALERFHVKG
ncbi:putative short chain dehydrogenase [Xylogone sp. PMI_703]|nr:putative short chain dehydrogenase [Xylogone sp. PMI_703]